MKIMNSVVLAVALLGVAAVGVAQGECKQVRGRVTSEVVAVFTSGVPCPSLLGLCTEGRFTGPLKGRFTFVANTLAPFNWLEPNPPMDVVATTGVISLDTKFCRGMLVLQDAGSFSLGPDGFFATLSTLNEFQSTGRCSGATGRLRLAGVFEDGCVDCEYEGEICGTKH